jgi:hypothetical protein
MDAAPRLGSSYQRHGEVQGASISNNSHAETMHLFMLVQFQISYDYWLVSGVRALNALHVATRLNFPKRILFLPNHNIAYGI